MKNTFIKHILCTFQSEESKAVHVCKTRNNIPINIYSFTRSNYSKLQYPWLLGNIYSYIRNDIIIKGTFIKRILNRSKAFKVWRCHDEDSTNMMDHPSSPDAPLIHSEKIRLKTRRNIFPWMCCGHWEKSLSSGVEKLTPRCNSRDLSRADVPSDCSVPVAMERASLPYRFSYGDDPAVRGNARFPETLSRTSAAGRTAPVALERGTMLAIATPFLNEWILLAK